MRGKMYVCFTFADNAYADLCGQDIKFWAGEGLPTYEGGLDGFAECHPDHFAELLQQGVVKEIPDDDPAPM